jgi:2,4-dienoyl-CoA reductase-like NADH-dependent reductase (Old Yellow Enzyme family)
LLEKSSRLGLAYLHLVRRSFPKIDNFAHAERHWHGNLILNNDLTGETAAAALAAGQAEAVSFGRFFIANPDLVERLRQGVALAEHDQGKLYTPGPEGFTDYPTAT